MQCDLLKPNGDDEDYGITLDAHQKSQLTKLHAMAKAYRSALDSLDLGDESASHHRYFAGRNKQGKRSRATLTHWLRIAAFDRGRVSGPRER